MPQDVDGVLIHHFVSVATDDLTGRQALITREVWLGPERAWLIVRFPTGHVETFETDLAAVLRWRAWLFGDDPGGQPRPLATVTNLDGTPALGRLREGLRRRAVSESVREVASLLLACGACGVLAA